MKIVSHGAFTPRDSLRVSRHELSMVSSAVFAELDNKAGAWFGCLKKDEFTNIHDTRPLYDKT
jgi:hypothetical protein